MIGVAFLPLWMNFDGGVEDARMERIEEMMRLEESRDAVERFIVDQDGAEQRLLGLDIVRGLAERKGLFVVEGRGRVWRAWRAYVS